MMMMTMMMRLRSLHHQRSKLANGNSRPTEFDKHLVCGMTAHGICGRFEIFESARHFRIEFESERPIRIRIEPRNFARP